MHYWPNRKEVRTQRAKPKPKLQTDQAGQLLPTSAFPPHPSHCIVSSHFLQPLEFTAQFQVETSSHQIQFLIRTCTSITISSQFLSAHQHPPPAQLRQGVDDRCACCATHASCFCNQQEVKGNANVHRAQERGTEVPELILPITILMNLTLNFHWLQTLNKGISCLGSKAPGPVQRCAGYVAVVFRTELQTGKHQLCQAIFNQALYAFKTSHFYKREG